MRSAWLYLPFAVCALCLWELLSVEQNSIGHDYAAMISRLLMGATHFWQNGFALPHYSPHLYGGLPFLADPQCVYFSLPQWLGFFVDPWLASRISALVFWALGYGGMVKTAHLKTQNSYLAHLVALLFSLNGFFFARQYVGHLTFHPWPLVSWVLFLLLKPSSRTFPQWVKDTSLLSLLMIYLIYSGSIHCVVLFVFMGAILLPYLFYRNILEKSLLRTAAFLIASTLLVLLACSGKLAATFLYSRHFHHNPLDAAPTPALGVIFRYFWFLPTITPRHIRFGHWDFGAWEYLGFLSRLALPLMGLSLLSFARAREGRCLWLFGIYALWLPALLLLCQGTEFNALLPFFKNYHAPIRLLAAFIPVFCLLCLFGLSWLTHVKKPELIYFSLSLFFLAEFLYSASFFTSVKLGLGYRYSGSVYRSLSEQRRAPAVREIVLGPADHARLIEEGRTSIPSYEPLFGYRGEAYSGTLRLGPTSQIHGDAYNMNHPGCFLYEHFYHCRAWDRIPASQTLAFQKFIEGKADAFAVPGWQILLYQLGFCIVGILCLPWLFSLSSSRSWAKASSQALRTKLMSGRNW